MCKERSPIHVGGFDQPNHGLYSYYTYLSVFDVCSMLLLH